MVSASTGTVSIFSFHTVRPSVIQIMVSSRMMSGEPVECVGLTVIANNEQVVPGRRMNYRWAAAPDEQHHAAKTEPARRI